MKKAWPTVSKIEWDWQAQGNDYVIYQGIHWRPHISSEKITQQPASISHFTKSYFLCTAAWISYPYPSPKYLLYLAKCFWKMDIWTSTSAEYAVTLVLQTQLGLWSLPRVPFPFAILNMLYQICYCVLLSSISCLFLSFTPCLLYFA